MTDEQVGELFGTVYKLGVGRVSRVLLTVWIFIPLMLLAVCVHETVSFCVLSCLFFAAAIILPCLILGAHFVYRLLLPFTAKQPLPCGH